MIRYADCCADDLGKQIMQLIDLLKNKALLRHENLIQGRWQTAPNQQSIAVKNPATGELIGYVPDMPDTMVQQAIASASAALPTFRELTAKGRADLLFRFRKAIMDNQADLAEIITAESGKPLKQAYAEIVSSANIIEWFAEEVKRIYGETIPPHAHSKRLMTIKQPIGVVAAITPWNFPSSIVTRKCAPALAAGCPIIIKPAPETPFSALALAYLSEQVGFPPGIFNVITGDAARIGAVICAHEEVRMLSFTGSTRVGKLLLAQSANTVKKVTLELGGNAPFIIFDDADIDKAVAGTIESKFRNSGQTCIAANRILVDEKIAPVYLEKLLAAVKQLKTGDPREADTDISALISHTAVERVASAVNEAVAQGADLLMGGEQYAQFYTPTILTNTKPEMRVNQIEMFAPVASIITFKDEAEAIAIANQTHYGLAGYFYSKDISRIYRVAEALETGMVGINTGSISTEVAPFGGVKQSGLGREGARYGIDEYVEVKYLCLDVS